MREHEILENLRMCNDVSLTTNCIIESHLHLLNAWHPAERPALLMHLLSAHGHRMATMPHTVR